LKKDVLVFLKENGLEVQPDTFFGEPFSKEETYFREELHEICLNDDVELLSFLLETHGTLTNNQFLRLVNTCCASASAEMVEYLVQTFPDQVKKCSQSLQWIMNDMFCESLPNFADRKLHIVQTLAPLKLSFDFTIEKGKFQPEKCYQYSSLFLFLMDMYDGDNVVPTLELLAHYGCDVNVDNFSKFTNNDVEVFGETPLRFSIDRENKNLSKLLINKGAYLNYVTCNGIDLLARDEEYRQGLIELGFETIPMHLYGQPYVFLDHFDDVSIPVVQKLQEEFKVKTETKIEFPSVEDEEINQEIQLQLRREREEKEEKSLKSKEEQETINQIKAIIEDGNGMKVERMLDVLNKKSRRRASQVSNFPNSDFLKMYQRNLSSLGE
jgi:hypothetical protein